MKKSDKHAAEDFIWSLNWSLALCSYYPESNPDMAYTGAIKTLEQYPLMYLQDPWVLMYNYTLYNMNPVSSIYLDKGL